MAAIQATSVPRDLPGNLQRIEPLIRSCAARGAQLVLLPELYSSGYGLTKADWACAESLEEVNLPVDSLPCLPHFAPLMKHKYMCRLNLNFDDNRLSRGHR